MWNIWHHLHKLSSFSKAAEPQRHLWIIPVGSSSKQRNHLTYLNNILNYLFRRRIMDGSKSLLRRSEHRSWIIYASHNKNWFDFIRKCWHRFGFNYNFFPVWRPQPLLKWSRFKVDIQIPIEIEIKIDGFYTLNIALQDLIGQPQFEMVISFRVSSTKFFPYYFKHPKTEKLMTPILHF